MQQPVSHALAPLASGLALETGHGASSFESVEGTWLGCSGEEADGVRPRMVGPPFLLHLGCAGCQYVILLGFGQSAICQCSNALHAQMQHTLIMFGEP